MHPSTPHVVIIGAGFGGLAAAKALRAAPVQVTLLDRTNHHLFQPLLYQVATAGLSAPEIAYPVRSILRRQKNLRVLMTEAVRVDLADRYVQTTEGILPYDHLILATGVQTSYFGRDADWSPHAIGLKSLEDALAIRRRFLYAFEQAEQEADPEKRRAWMTFVVIGGGPTGVEMAGALCELSRFVLRRDFRLIDPKQAHILLLEGGDRLLPSFHPTLSANAQKQLERRGVQVRLRAKVTHIDPQAIFIGEEKIPTSCVTWAAGVCATPLTQTLGVPLGTGGRVLVQPDLSLPGHEHAFAIGDVAFLLDAMGKPLPGTSPVAMQQGRYVAKRILQKIKGTPDRSPFVFFDKGSMATIGRSAAVAESGRLRLTGWIAWLAWLFVHLFFLIGFRNRFVVLFQWIWSYFTYQRGARLIIQRTAEPLPRSENTA